MSILERKRQNDSRRPSYILARFGVENRDTGDFSNGFFEQLHAPEFGDDP
jgi:hypothetical protein